MSSFSRGILVGAATCAALAASVAVVSPVSFDGAVAEAKTKPALWHEHEADRKPAEALPAGFSPLPSLAPLVRDLKPAVVSVATASVVRGRRANDPFQQFFGPLLGDGQRTVPRGQGSGFVIHESGLVLTNNHVIEGADQIRVKFADGHEYAARVVGRDPQTDVALLRLDDAKGLPTVFLGDSDRSEVGDWVVAIGNPFGLSHSVSVGIVSAKERFIGAGPYDDFIQTDAAINPGNSGGPLFNARGEVIGINTAIVAHGQGIGFAVPINLVKALVPQLEATGEVARGWLGVGIQDVSPELAEKLGVKEARGAVVAQVYDGSPAEEAGLKPGDVVVSVDGKEIAAYNQLSRTIAFLPPGKAVKLGVVRDGERIELEVAIGGRDLQGNVFSAKGERPAERRKAQLGLLGLSAGEVPASLARKLGMARPQGVVVERLERDGPAERSGIDVGDVILEVNRKPIRGLADFHEAARNVAPGESVLLRLQRGDSVIYTVIRTRR